MTVLPTKQALITALKSRTRTGRQQQTADSMTKAKVTKFVNRQALRLSEKFRVDCEKIVINRLGGKIILSVPKIFLSMALESIGYVPGGPLAQHDAFPQLLSEEASDADDGSWLSRLDPSDVCAVCPKLSLRKSHDNANGPPMNSGKSLWINDNRSRIRQPSPQVRKTLPWTWKFPSQTRRVLPLVGNQHW
jgi:hypothetical protein